LYVTILVPKIAKLTCGSSALIIVGHLVLLNVVVPPQKMTNFNFSELKCTAAAQQLFGMERVKQKKVCRGEVRHVRTLGNMHTRPTHLTYIFPHGLSSILYETPSFGA
jgi:hypothetical protein